MPKRRLERPHPDRTRDPFTGISPDDLRWMARRYEYLRQAGRHQQIIDEGLEVFALVPSEHRKERRRK